jgi:hypothetical protein
MLAKSHIVIFEEKSLNLIRTFICFACHIRFKCSASQPEVTLLLNLENHSKTCVLPPVCPPKATFNVSEVSTALPTSLKWTIMLTRCSFKSVIYYVHQNHIWNNIHLYLAFILLMWNIWWAANNASTTNVWYLVTYIWQRWKEPLCPSRHNVSTLNQSWKTSYVISVCTQLLSYQLGP